MCHINAHCLTKEIVMDLEHGLHHLDLASLVYSFQGNISGCTLILLMPVFWPVNRL